MPATADFGGFDHNAHALRLVTKLEHRYADFDGLNLTWETLEGLVKHNGPLQPPLRAARSPVFDARWPLELATLAGTGGAGRSACRRHRLCEPRHRRRSARRICSRSTILRRRRLPATHVKAVRSALWRAGTRPLHRRTRPYTDERAGRATCWPRRAARIAAAAPASAADVRKQKRALAAFSDRMLTT